MSYTSKLKRSLNNCLKAINENRAEHCNHPTKDFTRHKKIDFDSVMKAVLCFSNGSLNKEIFEFFGCRSDTATVSAFVQQRSKIKASAFEALFYSFIQENQPAKHFHGYSLIAVDGSDLYVPKNKNDPDSICHNHTDSSFNLYHLNAFYDLLTHTYLDAVIQKRRNENEHSAYVTMVDRYRYSPKAIFIADRNYESYNDMAHVQEAGHKFLTRLRDVDSKCILKGFNAPSGEFDISSDLQFIRRKNKQTKEMMSHNPNIRFLPPTATFDYLPAYYKRSDPTLFFELHVRLVRVKLDDGTYELLATNLDENEFPPPLLKELYSMRWGIETSFRKLKYTIGLLHFHSKKPEHILQEIFAKLTMYNFTELVTLHIAIRKKKRKLTYKINFSVAAHVCRKFFLGVYALKSVEAAISRNLLPFRPNLSKPRHLKQSPPTFSFYYRVA